MERIRAILNDKVIKGGVVAWLLMLGSPFYLAFVVLNLWNWFVAEAIHASNISYWQACGLAIFVYVVSFRDAAQQHWTKLFLVLDGCLREDKEDSVCEAVTALERKEWLIDLLVILVRLGIYSGVLGIGWGIRSFLM